MNEPDLIGEQSGGVLLTPDGYKKLQLELEQLTLVKRPEIADRIRESQSHGEFAEDNSELDEVKFEQAMVEGRIAELKSVFGNAHLLDMKSVPTDFVGLGSMVKVKDIEYGDDFEVRLVSSIESDPNNDSVSNESPLGMAIVGHSKGDTVQFTAPEGVKRYKILDISR